MKKTLSIIATFLICTLYSYGQKTLIVAGLDGGYAINKTGMAGLFAGFKKGSVNLLGGFQCLTSDRINDGISLQLKGGYDFYVAENWSLSPYIGYARRIKSNDRKELNSSSLLLCGQINHDLYTRSDERMRVYLSFTNAGSLAIISVGIQGLFGNN